MFTKKYLSLKLIKVIKLNISFKFVNFEINYQVGAKENSHKVKYDAHA